MSAWQVLTDFAILKEITCPSPTSGKEHTSIASSSAKTWQCGLVGGAITILKNISQWMSMGRIIPYIMENKKMFETTNQWYFGAVDGCGKMWMAMWTAAPRNTRSSRSDRSTSTIWSWWIEGANTCHTRALRKIQWPLSSSTCQKIDHFWMYLAAIWGGLRKKLLMFNTIQLVNTQLWCSGAGSTMADGLHVQTLKPTSQQAILPETQKSTCGWRKVAGRSHFISYWSTQ